MNRPQTKVILCMTADGKITDKASSAARFGSQADKLHLEKQISLVDGVLFGAGTLRSYGTTLSIANQELLQARQNRLQSPQPFQIVCSASGNLAPQLRFFNQPVPRWLVTTSRGAALWREKTAFERILVSARENKNSSEFRVPLSSNGSQAGSIEWSAILAQFKQLGIEKLAILGGGKLVASLLEVDAVDELHLTICPVIFGGQNASTPVEGTGWLQSQGRKLELINVDQIEQEVFLHYKVKRVMSNE